MDCEDATRAMTHYHPLRAARHPIPAGVLPVGVLVACSTASTGAGLLALSFEKPEDTLSRALMESRFPAECLTAASDSNLEFSSKKI